MSFRTRATQTPSRGRFDRNTRTVGAVVGAISFAILLAKFWSWAMQRPSPPPAETETDTVQLAVSEPASVNLVASPPVRRRSPGHVFAKTSLVFSFFAFMFVVFAISVGAELGGNADPGRRATASSLSTFTRHVCVIDSNSDLRCWGQNTEGAVGNGTLDHIGDGPGEMGNALPLVDLGAGRTVQQAATGYNHTCALLDGGDVKCWGRNDSGQLGYGDTSDRGGAPGQMGDNLPIVDLGTGRTATALAVSYNHTCAILDDGTVKCWGGSPSGETGSGSIDALGDGAGEMGDNLPTVDLGTGRTATAIDTGVGHTCAILDDGSVKCWGYNGVGELGLGIGGHVGDGPGEMGDSLAAVDLGTGRTAHSISLAFNMSCVIMDNGGVKCWGNNSGGRLGIGDTTHRGAGPTDMGDNLPEVNLGTGRTAIAMDGGNDHNCAILDDLTVKCWGEGWGGKLGYGNVNGIGSSNAQMGDNLPTVDLGTGRTAEAIAAGDGHTCVILDDGTVKCWGFNSGGSLGHGDNDHRGDGPNEMGDNLLAVDMGAGVVAGAPPDPLSFQLAIMANWNVGGTPRACQNDGVGNWSNCTSIPITDGAPDGTSTIADGDFNGDGRNDVVIGNQNGTLNSCLREADGSWTCSSNGQTGRHRGIGVGDFNGDGSLDFAGAIETASNMDVCLNNGSGAFTCSRVAAPNGGRDIVVNDYDGDGDLDLAYAATPGPSAICANDGNANFTCTGIAGTGTNLGVAQGDINNDGNVDLAFAGLGTTDELLCLGDGSADFTCSVLSAGGYHSQVKIGDLNNDSNLDILVAADGASHRSCLGNGTATLTCSDVVGPPANAGAVALGHIDGDGVLDALYGSVGSANMSCLGLGNGQFSCSDLDPTVAMNTQGVLLFDPVASTDFDADGIPNGADNCPYMPNAGQSDADADLLGDICDSDDDNDGLSDIDEGTAGTNPLTGDTDADGLLDGDEINIHGTDPTLADTDTDTLPDGDEINIHGTDPTLADTDTDTVDDAMDNCPVDADPTQLDSDTDGVGDVCDADDDEDGLTDVNEGVYGTDPLNPDSDGDTLSDGDEVNVHNTDPTLTDTDGDTYDDDVEISNGSNPLIPPAAQSITFNDPADANFNVGSFTVVSTSGSGLPVTITATGPCTASGFTITPNAIGTCSITSSQPGDFNWQAAPSITRDVEIIIGAQSINYSPIPALTFGDAPVDLTFSATSGLPVAASVTGPCSLTGVTLSIDGAGDCTVTFEQPGNANWAAATTVNTVVGVAQANQIITVTPLADTTFGTSQTVTATATSGYPTTTSTSGPCVLVGDAPTLTIDATGVGTCTLTFDQAGDADWLAAATETTVFEITPADQAITITPIADRFFDEGPFDVVVNTPSNLPLGVVATGSCTSLDSTITPTGIGDCTVTIDQSGDANWNPATTVSSIFTVSPGRQTIALETPVNPTFGTPVSLVAPSTSGLPVDVATAGTCTSVGTEITFTTAGDCTLTVNQLGDANWAPAPAATTSFTVDRAQQSLALGVPESVVFGAAPIEAVPTATSSLGVDVLAAGACALDGTTISFHSAGACQLTAAQAGDSDWHPAPDLHVVIAVAKAPQAIGFNTPAASFGDAPINVPGAASSGLPVGWTADGACSIADGLLFFDFAGTCEVTGMQAGDLNWRQAESLTTSFVVGRASARIIVVANIVSFDEASLGAKVSTEPADLDSLEILYEGSPNAPTDPGTYALEIALNNSNFEATPISTTFTVLDPPPEASPTTPSSIPEAFDEPGEQVRFVSLGVEEIADNGLPEPSGATTVLTITGLEPGTIATLSDRGEALEVTADADGSITLTISPTIDLAEATLVFDSPTELDVMISTEEVARMGGAAVVVDIRVNTDSEVDGSDDEGTLVEVKGTGLNANSVATAVVHSTPIEIGTVEADANGTFDSQLVLPADLEFGEHRILIHADTPDGQLTGTWFFALEEGGAIERVGDPPALVEETEPEPATPDAIPFAQEVQEEPAGDADSEEPIDEELDATVPEEVVIDVATGLPVYDPVAEPEQTIESGVNGFTIVTVMTAAAGSMAALGSITSTTTSTSGMAGAASGTGAAASGISRRRNSSGSAEESGGSRGKGKIASGKASGLGDGVEAVAWGDGSVTWRWPLVAGLDRLSRELPDRVRPASPLAARIVADGSTLRALFGTGALAGPLFGLALGIWAAVETGGAAVAPSMGVMMALILVGIFDASAGATAALTFAMAIAVSGGIVSPDSARTVMGVGSLWYAVPLIAGGTRKFRRPVAVSWEDRWQRLADVAVGSLMGAWTVQTVLKALPALSAVELPIAESADEVALLALAALVARYLLETIAVGGYPERMARTAPIGEAEPGTRQKLASTLLKAAVFVFVIVPYTGLIWPLAIVVALMTVPSLLGLIKDRFPNSPLLHRVLPKGVPAILFFMVVGSTIGAALSDRVTDPANLAIVSFVVLSIPGFINSMLGLFGRDGGDIGASWFGRFAGLAVTIVAYLAIRGEIAAPLIRWVPLAVAPAFLWWAVKAWREAYPTPDDDVDSEAEEPPENEAGKDTSHPVDHDSKNPVGAKRAA